MDILNYVVLWTRKDQLRHKHPALTLGVYTHVIEESRRRAVEQVENDLFSIVLTAEEATQAQTPVE